MNIIFINSYLHTFLGNLHDLFFFLSLFIGTLKSQSRDFYIVSPNLCKSLRQIKEEEKDYKNVHRRLWRNEFLKFMFKSFFSSVLWKMDATQQPTCQLAPTFFPLVPQNLKLWIFLGKTSTCQDKNPWSKLFNHPTYMYLFTIASMHHEVIVAYFFFSLVIRTKVVIFE